MAEDAPDHGEDAAHDSGEETAHDQGADSVPIDPADAEPVLDELFTVVEDRKEELPEGSYTASLFAHEKGENRVLEKLGEETTELVLAAKDDDHDELLHEAADLVYHLLVLLSMHDLTLAELRAELRERR